MWSAIIFLFAVCPIDVDAATDLYGFQYKCPYASLWLEHGAERATQMLSSEPIAPTSSGAVPRCALPPGLPSGAHQHALSPGYSTNCSGTPAQGSPYMYPMAWKANTETISIPFGNSTPIETEVGVDWFRFDRNWIRKDTDKGSGKRSVSIFRGDRLTQMSLMGDNITFCVWINMSLVGPNRPDWFLDAVGGAPIDGQYIGKKAVFYEGKPRLVREWRKNGIQNEYMTLQMDEYLTDENNHTRYPLIANIPGETVHYDHLKTWTDHQALDLDDLAPFLLDQTLPPGKCFQAPAVPPGPKVPHKSAFDLDPNSFRHVVWSGSPYAPSPGPLPPPPPPPAQGSYECSVCRHVYDPVKDGAGVPFEKLPDTWTCPICGAPKSAYKMVEGAWEHEHVEQLKQ